MLAPQRFVNYFIFIAHAYSRGLTRAGGVGWVGVIPKRVDTHMENRRLTSNDDEGDDDQAVLGILGAIHGTRYTTHGEWRINHTGTLVVICDHV